MSKALIAAAERVSKFCAEWRRMRGKFSEEVYGLNIGHEREAVLLTADLEALAKTAGALEAAEAKLERVRELHRKWTYYDHEDACPNTSEEHREEKHHESEEMGEFYCEDMPTGDVVCDECRDDDGERVAWPCPTVRALGGDAE